MEVLRILKNGTASVLRSLSGFFKGLGGTLTAVAVAVVGIYGSNVLDRSRARDADTQLYAQLMSNREDAETSLRKDMFNSIIGSFIKTSSGGYPYEQQVLNLELLAYNFHEALDLAPLFKHVYTEIHDSKKRKADDYMKRLEKVATEVKNKQIAALEESGGKLDATINRDEVKQSLNGVTVINNEISPQSRIGGLDPSLQKAHFKVEVLNVDTKKKEIRVKLEVRQAQQAGAGKIESEAPVSDSVFTVSTFDFPMIDNSRLPRGQRCAVVVRHFGDSSVDITLVYFPGSRASLKEKPFYDEAMNDLLYTRNLLEKRNGL